jgi:hypothetical protein
MASILSLVGWERFQHYRDRDPPWVKLYRDLLTSESWVLGTDTSRLVQVASVLLAARYGNKIPFDWKLIRKVASLDCTPEQFSEAVSHLATYGFLEIQQVPDAQPRMEQSASAVLAKCSSEAEGEKRQSRGETEERGGARSSRAPSAKRVPEDFTLTDQRRATAKTEGVDPDREFSKFTDYWRSASGASARKHDWDAAWRNWCRKAHDMRPNGRAGPVRPTHVPSPTTEELEAREAARAR